MDPHAGLLLRKAHEDRAALEFDLPEAIFGFHAQQAYEKSMKSLIASRNCRFDRTHDLEALAGQVEALGLGPIQLPESMMALQSYAVFLRYDDPEPMQTIDRAKVKAEIDAFLAFVDQKLTIDTNAES